MRKRSLQGAVLGACLIVTVGAVAAENQAPAAVVNPHLAPPPAAPMPGNTVIVRFDGGTITVADLDAAVAEVRGPERLEYKTAEPLRELLLLLVDRQLMARAARAAYRMKNIMSDTSMRESISKMDEGGEKKK